MTKVWDELNTKYSQQDWVNKSSIFAKTAITYFPKNGSLLELGAGNGQDSQFFAEQGFTVTATDISDKALELIKQKLDSRAGSQKLDLEKSFPFKNESFDIVYAHLSLHYFDRRTTQQTFDEISRVLKPGGVLALLLNSVDDPEYGIGEKIEKDYFVIGNINKRFLSTDSLKPFVKNFQTIMLDNQGATYKDSAIGVYNLIRFIGRNG